MNHPKSNIERLYVKRKARDKGLLQTEATNTAEKINIAKYFNTMYYPGTRGGSLATICTPNLTICRHFFTFVWSSYNIGNRGFFNQRIFCMLSARRRRQGLR